MKILELEINKVRGIKNLKLIPNGKTFVVWGPNGTGKSGVIDSVDFLLTGQVTRLTGAGTKDLSLKKHGPHIDEDIKDAFVRAKVKLQGINEPIEIRRDMANPTVVIIEEKHRKKFDKIFDLARRGQHVLTRREILHYVTSESGTRAEEIQILLNIHEVERIRKNFVRISNNASKTTQSSHKVLEQAKSGVNSTTQERSFSEESILDFINKNRVVLSGLPITSLDISKLKEDITSPKVIGTSDQNITLIEKDIANIKNIQTEEKKKFIGEVIDALFENLARIIEKPDFINLVQRKSLFEIGLKTIRDENISNCPLCEHEWLEGELDIILNRKLDAAKEITDLHNQVKRCCNELETEINILNSSLMKIINLLSSLSELAEEKRVLEDWFESNKNLQALIEQPLNNIELIQQQQSWIEQSLFPISIESNIELILNFLKGRFPQTTPEQNAWDTLTRLEENLKAIGSAQSNYINAKIFEKRAVTLQTKFEESRDKILNELYGTIQDRFVDLYKQLHGDDEKSFVAKLEPKGAALNFEVDFYGRGAHPPHALHSEGHQDSMGLCLFLSLAEFLARDIIDVLLLDDVVMSVDSEHRKSLCKVLANAFPNKQFIITTHDRTWANQLKSENLVTSKTSYEFYNWNLATGPHMNHEQFIWQQINEFIEKNDIPLAAAKLRRGAESFFETVCDNLEASVVYRQSHRWELGVFMQAAQSRYLEVLKKAKEAANSWNQKELVERFSNLDSTANQIFQRTRLEDWGINSSVHYNAWANLSKQDFAPIAESFEDLFNVFICQSCKNMIKVTSKDMVSEMAKCDCGEINWNLKKKK